MSVSVDPRPSNSSQGLVYELFEKACKESEKRGKVTLWTLVKLTTKVRCTPETIDFRDYSKIRNKASIMECRLEKQKSNCTKYKRKKIKKAVRLVENNLNVSAGCERIYREIKLKEEQLLWARATVLKELNSMEEFVGKRKCEVVNAIADIPVREVQELANYLLKNKKFRKFKESSTITGRYFTKQRGRLKMLEQHKRQLLNDNGEDIWGLVLDKGADLEIGEKLINKIKLILKSEAEPFILTIKDGQVEFNENQRILIDCANVLSPEPLGKLITT